MFPWQRAQPWIVEDVYQVRVQVSGLVNVTRSLQETDKVTSKNYDASEHCHSSTDHGLTVSLQHT